MIKNLNWKSSFHGGHCGEFCEHAKDTLEEVVQSAIEKKFKVYGISEHVPRYYEEHLFDTEKEKNWDVEKWLHFM